MSELVLFVCTANICRSPTAEAIFNQHAEAMGLDVRAESAGTQTWRRGARPDPRAVRAAHARGYDITTLRGARHVIDVDLSTFDRLIAMSPRNWRDLVRRGVRPELLGTFSDPPRKWIPDPFHYQVTFGQAVKIIESACQGLLRSCVESTERR